MDDYDDAQRTAIRNSIASAAGVDPLLVSIAVTGGSVIVTATIAVPASTTDAAVESALSSSLGTTAAAASTALGVTVESVPTIAVGSAPAHFVQGGSTWTVAWHVADGDAAYAEGEEYGSLAEAQAKYDQTVAAGLYAARLYEPRALWTVCAAVQDESWVESVVTVGGGSWDSEITWTVACEGMDEIIGGAPYDATHSVPPGGACTLYMVDSYGDGWNGGTFSAPGWLGSVTHSMSSGSAQEETFTPLADRRRQLSDHCTPGTSNILSQVGSYAAGSSGWLALDHWATHPYKRDPDQACSAHCSYISGPCDWCYEGHGCCQLGEFSSHVRCPSSMPPRDVATCVELLPAPALSISPSAAPSTHWTVAYWGPLGTYPATASGVTFATEAEAQAKFDQMEGGGNAVRLYNPELMPAAQYPNSIASSGPGGIAGLTDAASSHGWMLTDAWAADPVASSPSPPSMPTPPSDSVSVTGPCVLVPDEMNPNRNCIASSGYGAPPSSPGYGPGPGYASGEVCTISGLPSLPLSIEAFNVEPGTQTMGGWECVDYLIVNGQRYCGAVGPVGVCPAAGQSVNWVSTLPFVTATGWKVCWDYGSTECPALVPEGPDDDADAYAHSPPSASPDPAVPGGVPGGVPSECSPEVATVASLISVSGGSYPSEVSWTLTCTGACAPITGGAPHESDEAYMLPPNASCTLEMVDSYGDGWNNAEFTAPGWLGDGVAYSIEGASGMATFLVPSAAIPVPDPSPPPPPIVPVLAADASWISSAVSVPGGSYPSEVSWSLSCEGMLPDIAGGAPYDATHSVPPGAACHLAMVDSYGDGWNGASFNAPGWLSDSYTVDGTDSSVDLTAPLVAAPFPAPAPPAPLATPCASADDTWVASVVNVPGGSYPSEVSWTLSCAGMCEDDVISGGPTAEGGEMHSVPPGAACTLEMVDSYGDGWNGTSRNHPLRDPPPPTHTHTLTHTLNVSSSLTPDRQPPSIRSPTSNCNLPPISPPAAGACRRQLQRAGLDRRRWGLPDCWQ